MYRSLSGCPSRRARSPPQFFKGNQVHGFASFVTTLSFVQYTAVASTAMFSRDPCPEAITVTPPPPMGARPMVPSPPLAQYTYVASTAIPMGPFWPDASVVAAPPVLDTCITVPPTL